MMSMYTQSTKIFYVYENFNRTSVYLITLLVIICERNGSSIIHNRITILKEKKFRNISKDQA
jgi:hypothetical protein